MSSLPDVVAGISMHPSHSPIMELLGEDERQVLEDITDNAPQLFMPSGGDHKVLEDACVYTINRSGREVA